VANRELETFSYSVAHDLRAPLRSIHGFSHILLEDYSGSLDEKAKLHLQRIGAGAETMGQLIDALLGLSRLSRAALQRETVDLAPLAETVVKQLQAVQPERVVEFVNLVTEPAHGDPALLRAVLEKPPRERLEIHERMQDSAHNVGVHSDGDWASLFRSGQRRWVQHGVLRQTVSPRFSGCTRPASSPAQASDWRRCSGSLHATVAAFGRRERSTTGPPSTSPSKGVQEGAAMTQRPILLVEDNEADEMLTLRAFKKNNILNEVVVARDGQEALDYLSGVGTHAGRDLTIVPQLVLWTSVCLGSAVSTYSATCEAGSERSSFLSSFSLRRTRMRTWCGATRSAQMGTSASRWTSRR